MAEDGLGGRTNTVERHRQCAAAITLCIAGLDFGNARLRVVCKKGSSIVGHVCQACVYIKIPFSSQILLVLVQQHVATTSGSEL